MGQKLNEIMKNVNKRFGEEIISQGIGEFDYRKIPFTSPRMNYCTYGGIPIGKLTEFFGEEHGGKTTTALDVVANYQRSDDNRDVLYVDAENLWVLDSVGALVSDMELDEKRTYEDKVYGGISLPMTRFVKKITMFMHRYDCTGLIINQIRENLNSPYGGITTPGGKALKHHCACRFQFARGKYIDEKGNELNKSASEPFGNIVLMSMVKNSTCPPSHRTGQYTLRYDDGVDYLSDLVDVAIKFDVIVKSGSWFDIVDTENGDIIQGKIHGLTNVYEYLREHEDALTIVENIVNKEMKKS